MTETQTQPDLSRDMSLADVRPRHPSLAMGFLGFVVSTVLTSTVMMLLSQA